MTIRNFQFGPVFAAAAAFLLARPASAQSGNAAAAPAAAPADTGDLSLGVGVGNAGDWRFVPSLSTVATYDDNIFITAANQAADTYFQVAPGFALGKGDFRSEVAPFAPIPHFLAETGEEDLPKANFFFLDYTPDFEWFVRHHAQDTVNQDVRLAAEEQDERWNLQGGFRYQRTTDPNIYVGGRARQSYFDENARAAYALTGKITAGFALSGRQSAVTGGLSQDEERAEAYGDYQYSDKTAVGAGLGVAGLQVQGDPNQIILQPELRMTYQLTAKIWIQGEGGADLLRPVSGGANQDGARFDVSAHYSSSESTSWTASFRRDVAGAVEYRGVDVWESAAQAGVSQRLPAEFVLTGAAGLVWDNYRPFASGVALARRDRYFFYRPAIAHDLTRHGTVQASFEHRENDSSLGNFWFVDNLAAVTVSFLF